MLTAGPPILDVDPSVKIGGPAVSIYRFEWIEALAEYCKEKGLPLDFVSWHDYCRQPKHYSKVARETRAYLDKIFPKSEIIIDEWNYHFALVPENDNHIGAARVAGILAEMINAPVDYAPFFEAKDGFSPNVNIYYGRWGLFTYNQRPKAAFYVFQAYARLGEEQVESTINDASMSVFATRDKEQIKFILATEKATDQNVIFTIRGCESNKYFKVSRYLIDIGHSNPVRGTEEKLALVEQDILTTRDGILQFTKLVPTNSTSLIECETTSWLPGLKAMAKEERAASLGLIQLEIELPKVQEIKSIVLEGDLVGHQEPIIDTAEDKIVANITVKTTIGADERHQFISAIALDANGNNYAASCHFIAKRAIQAASKEIPLSPKMESADLSLEVENLSGEALDATIVWSSEPVLLPSFYEKMPYTLGFPDLKKVSLEPYKINRFPITVVLPETIWGSMDMFASLRLKDNDLEYAYAHIHLVPTYRAKKRTINIGKNGGNWFGVKKYPMYLVSESFKQKKESRELKQGQAESNASFGACYDDDNLYIMVKTKDNVHLQVKSASEMWQQDSLQISVDPLANAKLQMTSGLDPDDLEYAVSLNQDKEVSQFCWKAPENVDINLLTQLPTIIIRKRNTTAYYVAFPWTSLGLNSCPDKIGLSLVLNDCDAPDGERLFSIWGDGVAWSKNPWLYNRIILKE